MLRRWLQITAGTVLILAIVGYTGYQIKDWRTGPTVDITTPQAGTHQTPSSPLVTIKGKAERIAYLHLNGRQIYTDPDGTFKESLLLSPGYNIITVSAKDKFNRTTEKRLELILPTTNTDLLTRYGQKRRQNKRGEAEGRRAND
jgi:hypothetical protein